MLDYSDYMGALDSLNAVAAGCARGVQKRKKALSDAREERREKKRRRKRRFDLFG